MAANPSPRRRWLRPLKWGCLAFLLLVALGIALLYAVLSRVPKNYPAAAQPIEPPAPDRYETAQLDGFESPYLGHTGSWDGKGGAMFGKSKAADLDREASMGLRWTFMPVYWRALEPDGPADLSRGVPPAWAALDEFVRLAHARKLNILFQAPVIGGNAGGPPDWAGRREPGKSAPARMDAAAQFAGKLAARYCPGGVLATREGWGQNFGVRAWELDNEPDGYLTHWKGQAADYAEFVTRAAAAIREADPRAVIAGPGVMGGGKAVRWLEGALNASALAGSPAFRANAKPYSVGPALDAVSFHVYEGLDSAFGGSDRTIEVVFGELRQAFDRWENREAEFAYKRKQDYWHTEGNFDFFGVLSKERRAAWRVQFMTRAFAAGIRKVCVMDASEPERKAVGMYVQALPDPFPMAPANDAVHVRAGKPAVFRHRDRTRPGRTVWVLWATAGTGQARVDIPATAPDAVIATLDGSRSKAAPAAGKVTVRLAGDGKMAPPVLVIEEAGQAASEPQP